MSGTADLMCQLYDCPRYYNKKLRTINFKLEDVCFNIMSATTPSRFLKTSNPEDFQSGFLSRFLIIYGEKKLSLPRRTLMKADFERRDRCKTLWKQIYDRFHTSQLKFEFEAEALEWANAWETSETEEVLNCSTAEEADLKGALITRMAEYVYKFSALYEIDKISRSSLSKFSSSTITVSIDSVKKATSTIDNLLTLLTTNLLTLLTETRISRELAKLVEILENKAESDGYMMHSKLLPLMNVDAYRFKTIVQTAIEQDLIEFIDKKTQSGRTARFYKLN